MMCLEQTENRFHLISQVFANNNMKLHYFFHNFDSYSFTRQCANIH